MSGGHDKPSGSGEAPAIAKIGELAMIIGAIMGVVVLVFYLVVAPIFRRHDTSHTVAAQPAATVAAPANQVANPNEIAIHAENEPSVMPSITQNGIAIGKWVSTGQGAASDTLADFRARHAVPHCGYVTEEGTFCSVTPGGSGTGKIQLASKDGQELYLSPGLKSGAYEKVSWYVDGVWHDQSPDAPVPGGYTGVQLWPNPSWVQEKGRNGVLTISLRIGSRTSPATDTGS